jgi:hypothetical protein
MSKVDGIGNSILGRTSDPFLRPRGQPYPTLFEPSLHGLRLDWVQVKLGESEHASHPSARAGIRTTPFPGRTERKGRAKKTGAFGAILYNRAKHDRI